MNTGLPLRTWIGKIMKKTFIICLLSAVLIGSRAGLSAEEQKIDPQWKTHLELSYVITSGNTDSSNMSGKLDVAKEEDINRYYLKGNALYGEEDNKETKNKWSLSTRWERIFTKRLFGFLSANYIEDKFSGYDFRIGSGPGLGYDIVKTKKHNLKGLISSLYYYDRYYDEASEPTNRNKKKDSYLSGKAETDYTWQILENLTFDQTLEYLVSFEDNKNEKNNNKYFIDSETALTVKVNKHISLGLSYIIAYQNQPPPDIEKHTDRTFLTSLLIDF